jgi:hypothetical protein
LTSILMSTDASSPLHCFQTVWGPGNRLGAGPPRDPPAALALGKAGEEAGRVGMFSTAPEPPSRAPQWQELQGSVYAQVFSLHGVRISAILCESVSACFFVRSAICPFPPPKTRIHTFAVCSEGGNFTEPLEQSRIVVWRASAVHAFRHGPFLQHVHAGSLHQRPCVLDVSMFPLPESFDSRMTGWHGALRSTSMRWPDCAT